VNSCKPIDKPHEECGVFGVYAPGEEVAELTYFGLRALQHRGQESAGIAVGDGLDLYHHKGMGFVDHVFDETIISNLKGILALGHTRYSTTGSSKLENAQPLVFQHPYLGVAAIAHNGNLINSRALRDELVSKGYKFKTSVDTEIIAALLSVSTAGSWDDAIRHAFPRIQGAYSCVVATPQKLYALRDPYGFRPLVLGQLPDNRGWIVASETCALDIVGCKIEGRREVAPGELIVIDETGIRASAFQLSLRQAMCIFEFIYFSRPDSYLSGTSLYEARMRMGRELAREAPVDADVVIPLPDSGRPAALGYAEELGIPYREALDKTYKYRSFIEATPKQRELSVRLKLNPIRDLIKGKRVVAVDDSIVRGTTGRRIVEVLRMAGAKEVHMRISSPPMRFPCFMGVDIAARDELVAAHRSVEEVRQLIGADSLQYLSMRGLLKAVGKGSINEFCTACFDGSYPVPVPQQLEADKLSLETV
jgi:amidophosphoribosyltransferase